MITEVDKILKDANLHRTYWGRRIIEAERIGGFTAEDRSKSEHWNTCACGRIESILMSDDYSGPIDPELNRLGLEFDQAVEYDVFIKAATLLIDIQARSTKLINEHV